MFPSLRRAQLAIAVAICCAAAAAAQEKAPEESAESKICRAIALNDQGRYPEAIKLYREVLAADPNYARALYELAFTLNASGDYGECVAIGERGLEVAKAYRAELFIVTGNCYDHGGRSAKAIEVFERGRREFPKESLLAYNFAVTQFQQKHLREARELAKAALDSQPSHASSYRVLAAAYQADGYEIPSLLAALRFLSIEPTSARAKEPASLAQARLFGSVSQDAEKNQINIFVAADAPADDGDFKVLSTTLGLIAAAEFLPETPSKTESGKAATLVKALLENLAEGNGAKNVDGVVRKG